MIHNEPVLNTEPVITCRIIDGLWSTQSVAPGCLPALGVHEVLGSWLKDKFKHVVVDDTTVKW